MNRLSQLSTIKRRKKKRVGRGYGSGKGGHTVGKGMKGQKSRSGFKKVRSWIRESNINSLPKLRGIGKRSNQRGFAKKNIKKYVINVSSLNVLRENSDVSISSLREAGLVKSRSKKIEVKILGYGKLDKKLVIRGINTSKNAEKKVSQAGGKVL